MKKIVLKAPHWRAGKLYQPGETIELTDEQYEWYVNAVIDARHAAAILVEETVGTPEWVAKERKKLSDYREDPADRDEGAE